MGLIPLFFICHINVYRYVIAITPYTHRTYNNRTPGGNRPKYGHSKGLHTQNILKILRNYVDLLPEIDDTIYIRDRKQQTRKVENNERQVLKQSGSQASL